ncbi:MAG: hypothetical protein OXI13_13710 [Gammaproteobacteria bacterium]|nr:hypothetical protein [Gammaproteobacteria bacterium]MDE0480668.1 hypothetical protein [Gammaproteobacteria bacterium]
MKKIDLQEYERSDAIRLSVEQRDELIRAKNKSELGVQMTIEPVIGRTEEYMLTPGSTIGAFETSSCSVCIAPKISIRQLISLLCYTIDQVRFQEDEFGFPEEAALPDALALALASAARRCFSNGLLHGYRTEEEALHTVRGRIRFDDQVRRRIGIPLPVEVRYDEFTDDILANRLVKAAAMRLQGMSLLSTEASRQLAWVAGMLHSVAHVEFQRDSVPKLIFDRLNEHYRSVVTLAQLILRHRMFESGRGTLRASGFLVDMAGFFQEFVTIALRNSLRISKYENFGEHHINPLDKGGSIRLRPDLTWWEDDKCRFVGDVKYKLTDGRGPNADLYQLLAYVTALDLPGGMLVYAKGEAREQTHVIRHSSKRLIVTALDLSGTLDQVLSKVDDIARHAKELLLDSKDQRSAA